MNSIDWDITVVLIDYVIPGIGGPIDRGRDIPPPPEAIDSYEWSVGVQGLVATMSHLPVTMEYVTMPDGNIARVAYHHNAPALDAFFYVSDGRGKFPILPEWVKIMTLEDLGLYPVVDTLLQIIMKWQDNYFKLSDKIREFAKNTVGA